MRSLLSTIALMGAALAGAALLGGGDAASQGAAASMRVAFVDLAEVVRKYDRSSQIDRELVAEQQKLKNEFRKPREDLNKMLGDLDILVEGTPKYREKKEEIAKAKFLLDYRQKEREREIRLHAMQKMTLVYTEIRNEAANYAQGNDYQAVMVANDGNLDARSPEELPALIALRTVIYWDKSLDITDEILKILNGE